MTRLELVSLLATDSGIDHAERHEISMGDQRVVFDTVDRANLTLLSAYVDDDGVLRLDIGTDGE